MPAPVKAVAEEPQEKEATEDVALSDATVQPQPAPATEPQFKDMGIQCELNWFALGPEDVTSVGKAK